MDDELVLLTSYFNLANGRRQESADTFRVDGNLPSRTAPDGTAALYIVTEASTGGQMGPRARRLAADTVAWEYSTHGDDPPAPRLRAALRTAHQEVLREFDGHVSVGMSAIAIEHDDVYLAQAAPGQVYVLHDGSLHSISASAEGTSPFAHALGSTAGADILVFRDKIGENDVLALCSSWFHRTADAENLRDCFGAGSADDIANSLDELGKQHGLRDATVVVIEAVRGSELQASEAGDEPSSFSEQIDVAVQALAGVGKMLMRELRGRPAAANGSRSATSDLQESSPVDDVALRGTYVPSRHDDASTSAPDQFTTEIPHLGTESTTGGAAGAWNPDETTTYDLSELQAAETEARPREHATQEVPIIQAEPRSTHASGSRPVPRSPISPNREPVIPADPPVDDPGLMAREQASAHEIDKVNSRIQQEPDMDEIIPPVQAYNDPGIEPSRIYAGSRDMQAVNRRPRRFGGINRPNRDAEGGAPVLRPGLKDIDFRPRIGREAPPAVIWAGMAIVLLLVAFAGYKFLSRHGSKAANNYPTYAKQQITRARTTPNPVQQEAALAAAQRDITLAVANGSTPAQLQPLRDNWQRTADQVRHITRVTAPIVAADFSKFASANPTELASGPNILYVLDSGRKAVFSITGNSSPNQVVASGDTDSGLQITTPVHLTTSGTTGLVLDDSNDLVRVDGGAKTAIVLTKPSSGQKIVAMTNVGLDVYLLDIAAGQVWRYAGAVADNSPAPVGFFQGNAPEVQQTVSFVLDDKAMYMLKGTGQVLKYDLQGNSQKFGLTMRSSLPGLNKPVFIFTDVGLNYVWVADPVNGRIVQMDKNGNYVRSYLSGSSATMDFSLIKSVVVPPGGKTLYVLAGKKLYDFPLQP